MATGVVKFCEDQVMVCWSPIAHDSPPFGLVTCTVGPAMAKPAPEVSKQVGVSIEVIRTRQFGEEGSVTVHEWVPSLAVEAAIVSQVEPELRLSSILTLPVTPYEFQVMFWAVLNIQDSPPIGEVTVMSRLMMEKSASLLSA